MIVYYFSEYRVKVQPFVDGAVSYASVPFVQSQGAPSDWTKDAFYPNYLESIR